MVSETFQTATIMFSDVVTFTNIAAACSPEKIVNMLNDMYERFDNATTRWDVYKVTSFFISSFWRMRWRWGVDKGREEGMMVSRDRQRAELPV